MHDPVRIKWLILKVMSDTIVQLLKPLFQGWTNGIDPYGRCRASIRHEAAVAMRSQIRLGKVFGIQIGLHYSWFLIALLIVFSLNAQFHLANPAWSAGLVLGSRHRDGDSVLCFPAIA